MPLYIYIYINVLSSIRVFPCARFPVGAKRDGGERRQKRRFIFIRNGNHKISSAHTHTCALFSMRNSPYIKYIKHVTVKRFRRRRNRNRRRNVEKCIMFVTANNNSILLTCAHLGTMFNSEKGCVVFLHVIL